MISNTTRDAVLERADIVEIVEESGVELKRQGRRMVACCPFHSEKTPSFHVDAARGTWHCFGACQTGGNVIDFVMKKEMVSYPEAVTKLAHRYHIDIDEEGETDQERETRLRREAIWGINSRVAAYYQEKIHEDSPSAKHAMSVASHRWTKEYVDEMGIGYAKSAGDDLYIWARTRGENIDLMIDAGLISRNEENGRLFDFYHERLVIPIRDRHRNIIGFTARDLTGESKAKYVNSKESDGYHKSSSVFGIDTGCREARMRDQWILVEGAADAMALHVIGFNNTVAPLGGSWTKQQMELLKRDSKCLCFINDADPPAKGERWGAGIDFVMRNGKLALELGFTVSVREISLGENGQKQDPGSYFSNERMMDTLTEEEFVVWAANKYWVKNANINQKAANARKIAELASLVKDDTRLDMIVDDLNKLNKGKDKWKNLIYRARIDRKEQSSRTREIDLRTYGFIEDHGCYYGLTDSGEEQWSNFTLKPLFHIRSGETPRRLFELKNNRGQSELLNLDMDDLNSVQKFRKRLESMGNYMWMGGDSEMMKLKCYLYENTDTADLVKQMGWSQAGFYAWGNGLWKDGEFHSADKYGIVRLDESDGSKEKAWFIPAAAKAFESGENDDVDGGSFALERKFHHRDLCTMPFGEYTRRFCEVWGDNGKVGLMYWLASLFRDIVMSHSMSFPLLDLFGPKGTGKTHMAEHLMNFFLTDNKPPNLRGATPASLGYDIGYSSNALVHFDEYKNDNINPKVVELLKGTYDGVGRTKMGGADYKERIMTSVKSGIIITGQEMPTIDIALFHRCVFLMFTKDTFSQEERTRLAELQETQKFGCTKYTLEALEMRSRVQVGFAGRFAEITKMLTAGAAGARFETRIVENWAKLLAVFKCVEGKLQFPFSFDEVYRLCQSFINRQNELSGDSNELAHFWRTVMFLRDNGDLTEGADYKLKNYVNFSGEVIKDRQFASPHPVLLLNMSRVFMLYKEAARRSGDKIIPDDALREYIKHTDCFLDYVKSVRFISVKNGYPETQNDNSGTPQTVYRVTRAMAIDYALLKEKYGISLDASTIGTEENSEQTKANEINEQELPF